MKCATAEEAGVSVTLIAPPPDLAPFVTALYRTVVAPGTLADDLLPPEWANLRAARARIYEAAIGNEPLRPVPPAVASGPTSRLARLRMSDGAAWGIGLLPLGFAQFLRCPATTLADRIQDADTQVMPEPLRDLLMRLSASERPMEDDVADIVGSLRALLGPVLPSAAVIVATHRALMSDTLRTAADFAALAGVGQRTLERQCARWFGFSPQLLLRRQRFLRSLGSYMTDPSIKWIQSLDGGYHDQPHFLRDFRRFLGMRPSDYRAMPHPIATLAARARREALGEVMQVLHVPSALLEE